MRRIKGKITETIIVQKDVEVEVPDDADEDVIEQTVRDEAYKECISDIKYDHGWEGIETLAVDVQWNDIGPAIPKVPEEKKDDRPESDSGEGSQG